MADHIFTLGSHNQAMSVREPLVDPRYKEGYEEKFSKSFSERLRHWLGLRTDTAELYSGQTLADAILRSEESSPLERVIHIFETDEYDCTSGQFLMMCQSSLLGVASGGVYGFYVGTQGIRDRFIQYHQATIFERPFDAKARLSDTLVFHGFRAATKYGFRFGLITLAFTTLTNVVAAARGKSGVIEYTLGGFTLGALYRMNLGLRGMAAAGCLGGLLGTFGGALAYGMLRLNGSTYEEMAYWKKMRAFNIAQARIQHVRPQVDDPSLRAHDYFLEQKVLKNSEDQNEAIALSVNSQIKS